MSGEMMERMIFLSFFVVDEKNMKKFGIWRENSLNSTKSHIDNKRWLLRYRPLWIRHCVIALITYIFHLGISLRS